MAILVGCVRLLLSFFVLFKFNLFQYFHDLNIPIVFPPPSTIFPFTTSVSLAHSVDICFMVTSTSCTIPPPNISYELCYLSFASAISQMETFNAEPERERVRERGGHKYTIDLVFDIYLQQQ